MATNLGNTRNAVEKNHHAWRPPSWNFLLDPRFPLRATRGPRTRQALISRACLALHALQRPPCAYALVTGTLTFTAKAVTAPWFCRIRDRKWGFPVTSALPSLVWKGRKNNACFSGYWSRVVRIFFYKNTISVSRKKKTTKFMVPCAVLIDSVLSPFVVATKPK